MKTKFPIKQLRNSSLLVPALFMIALTARGQSWTNYYNGPANGYDQTRQLAVSGSGNVAISGESIGSDGYVHRATILYSNSGLPLWTNIFDGQGDAADSEGGLALDSTGNVIVTSTGLGSNGRSEWATVKYSEAGVPMWTNYYGHPSGGGNSTSGAGVVVDLEGSVIVTGNSQSIPDDYFSADIAIVKYSSAGVPLWTNRFNGPGNGADYVKGLAVDTNGNVIVTGAAGSTSGPDRWVTIKYDPSGDLLWTKYAGTGEAEAIGVDPSGNVFVAGALVRNGFAMDFVTIKYSLSGTALWTNRFQGGSLNVTDLPTALAVDAEGNVIVTGQMDSGSIPSDFVTIKYSGAGVPVWTNIYSGPPDQGRLPLSLALDRAGNVLVGGAADGEVYPTIKYSSAGAPLWTNFFVGPYIALDNGGNLFASGRAWNGSNFDYVVMKYPVEVTSPSLNIQRFANSVVLSWTNAAFGLQSAPAITGTFTNIPGASSPYTNPISGGQRFFRLAQ